MYLLLPHVILFSSTLIISTLAVISSSTFLIIWAALELNLISLIPLILINNNNLESEAAVNYFLAQALGSSLFLISYLTISQNLNLITPHNTSSTLITIALIINLGAAPTHFWFPSVITSTSWPICIILATWQNVAPLTIILFIFTPINNTILIIAITSALVGGIIGLNQVQLTALLAYSSIGHLGWILSIINNSTYLTTLYFFIYIMTTGTLILILHIINIYSTNQIPTNYSFPPSIVFIPIILLLSLGGLPPLLGFAPNLIILNTLAAQIQVLLAASLIIGSTLNLSYYLTLIFNLYITSASPTTTNPITNTTLLSPSLIIVLPLFIAPLIF